LVDTQPTGMCSEQEDKFLTARLVIVGDGGDAVFVGGASIDVAVLYTYDVVSIYPYIDTKEDDEKEDNGTHYIA